MLLVWDKSDSIKERAQQINNKIKLHILGVWQNDHEFVRQLVYYNDLKDNYNYTTLYSIKSL